MIYSIAYVSSASNYLCQADLTKVFDYTVDWNISHNISGFLVHHNGNFIQLLEGEKEELTDLFSRIRVDSRHHDLIILLKQDLAQKSFDDYQCGFLISDSKLHTELKEYFKYLKLLEDPQINKTIGTIEQILNVM